jgi:hypothetical protein
MNATLFLTFVKRRENRIKRKDREITMENGDICSVSREEEGVEKSLQIA